jgi:hypothetical protein
MTLLVVGLTLPWIYFVCLAFLYAFVYEGNELIAVGFLFDAYMGYAGSWLPLHAAYSIAFTGMLICVWGLKPLIHLDRTESWNPS